MKDERGTTRLDSSFVLNQYSIPVNEVSQNLQSDRAALLRVELCRRDVVFLHCTAKVHAVITGGGDKRRINGVGVVGVNEVDARLLFQAAQQTTLAWKM